MKIPLYSYLAFNNPEGSVAVMKDFNYQVLNVRSRSDIGECLRQFILAEKEAGLNALAKIHPDRQLIIDNTERSMSADGTIETVTTTQQQAVASQQAVAVPAKSEVNYMPLLIGSIIAGSIFLGAAIIAKH
jgi:hypothetical protein